MITAAAAESIDTGKDGAERVTDWRDERASAFAEWARQRMPRSYRLAATILRDEAAAQDVVQDAVLHAWESWPHLRDRARFDAWLERIIVNRCRDRLRRDARARRSARVVELPAQGSPGDARAEVLREALARLSPDHRIVISLRYFEDLSVAQIAERTGVREGTVKSRLHYAQQALRAAYDAAEREG